MNSTHIVAGTAAYLATYTTARFRSEASGNGVLVPFVAVSAVVLAWYFYGSKAALAAAIGGGAAALQTL